jgi:hypothetical protein
MKMQIEWRKTEKSFTLINEVTLREGWVEDY